jgi:hypothetical protein
MKLYRNYTFTNKRHIWRIIPGGEDKIVIEERDPITREVFFSCLEKISGKVIIDSIQFAEKFWIGIEDVYKDVIFFHKYNKPDMPWHSDIIAFDINKKEQIWHSEEYTFSFVYDDILYCYQNKYEGRTYFKLNYLTGELIGSLGEDPIHISGLKDLRKTEIYEGYKFPETLSNPSQEIAIIADEIRTNEIISGKIDYLVIEDLLLLSYHKVLNDGKLQNCFKALEIHPKKVIFDEVLNNEITSYIPDSFFLINDLIFLLKDKDKLFVYIITD